VLEGEGIMEIDRKRQVVRKHAVIFLPPRTEDSISKPASSICCSWS
jgi:hypothetical protein